MIQTTEYTAEARRAKAARRSLLGFARWTMPRYQRARHLELLGSCLEQVERGELRRLMVFMPPRHGKSELISVRFPAWYMARHPERMVMETSYGADLAHDFGSQARNILLSQSFREVFPGVGLASDSKAAGAWRTTAGGKFVAAGIGGPITGKGAHLLLIDDPIKNIEEAMSEVYREKVWSWYTHEARPRLEPGGAIVLVMTRWHEDDLAGRLLADQDAGGEQWRVLSLPALAEQGDELGREPGQVLWPERYDGDALDALRGTVGSRAWISLYQQQPSAEEGNIFKWFYGYDAEPENPSEILVWWDTALSERETADETASSTWLYKDGQLYLTDAVHVRMESPDVVRMITAHYEELRQRYKGKPIRVFLQHTAIDLGVAQQLRQQTHVPIIIEPLKRGEDKVARAQMAVVHMEAERVLIPIGYKPWKDYWIQQHKTFPNAAHDDLVDCTSGVILKKLGRPQLLPLQRPLQYRPL